MPALMWCRTVSTNRIFEFTETLHHERLKMRPLISRCGICLQLREAAIGAPTQWKEGGSDPIQISSNINKIQSIRNRSLSSPKQQN